MAVTAPHAPAPAREVLALAEGVELIGEYEDSGFKEPPLLARRADGQMIQLTRLLYLVAAAADGGRDEQAVAAEVSERFGRPVSADNVRFVADERLRPLGVLALRDGTTPELPKRQAVFALRCRRPIVPERATNGIARVLVWLHSPAVVLMVVLALAGLDFWLFGVHGIAPALRSVIYDPTLLLAVLASTVIAAAWHECGHASACRYGGARPGVVGVGLYLVWPAFYCDVTEAYRLDRAGRLRTDLGGVYFNGIYALAAAAGYFATGQEAFLLVVFVQHTVVLQQLLPLLRFDGYYVLSDLTGVPDVLTRIKPIFRSLVPWRQNEPSVDELKPWVRFAVTAYLLALVPTLVFMFVSAAVSFPRIITTVHDSLGLLLERLRTAPDLTEAALAVVRIGGLLLPAAAISLSLFRGGRMALRGLVGWSRGSLRRRAVVVAVLTVLATALTAAWWPDGDYRPIRRDERGTLGEAVRAIPEYAVGGPSFGDRRTDEVDPGPAVPAEGEAPAPRPRGAAEPTAHQTPASPDGAEATTTPAQRDGTAPSRREVTPDETADAEEDSSEETSSPTTTATPTPGTAAPSPTSTTTTESTATPAPSPGTTAEPTATPTSTPTATSTPTPTPTPTPTAGAESTTDPTTTSTAPPAATPMEASSSPATSDTATATSTPAP